nr:MAG TPA: Transglycosylase SLT domain [Caudoviricetes sp.]
MRRLKARMQLAATILFAVIFGSIFVCGTAGGTPADTVQAVEPTDDTTEIASTEPTTEPTTVQTVTVEQQEETEATTEYVYYDVPLADELQRYIQDVCAEYEFERYDIIVALIQKESSFDETAVSETNDYGLMQINECNHEWLSGELGIDDFLDGEQNITAGVYLISDLYDKYEDIGFALMAYNCGEKGAKGLWQQGIYSTAYSRAVLETAESLEQR